MAELAQEFLRCSREVLGMANPVLTNWYAMSGAPSSGKTTCVQALAQQGYQVAPDVSRLLLEQGIAAGRSVRSSRRNESDFQKRVFCEMWRCATALDPRKVIIHDYALPDNIAFYRTAGQKVPIAVQRSAQVFRYRRVFLFEPLKLDADGVRLENRAQQLRIFHELRETYEGLNYRCTVVPRKLSLGQRVDLVASAIEEDGRGR